MSSGQHAHALDNFSPATREWFTGAFSKPTPAQAGAWEAIAAGKHALVVAPTGSGKTLAAFLWALDRLHGSEHTGQGASILYISPLKALGVDVERNLRSPLIGIAQTARRLGTEPPEITVGIRSGDTPAKQRRHLISHPPDILITTPESLYLMLTSQARSTLHNIDTVIIDEVHAVAGTKRGAHLAVSLERLDQILEKPAQRIGLSATVEPVETVARFLGGTAPVEIVHPPSQKDWRLRVSVPVPDMTHLPDTVSGPTDGSAAATAPRQPVPTDSLEAAIGIFPDDTHHEAAPATDPKTGITTPQTAHETPGQRSSLWPHIEERIVDLIERNRSTIVFTNSRGLTEKLTSRLNDIHRIREEARRGNDAGATAPLARAHHGSVSKDQREVIEDSLKSGQLRCVVATSSLELGIDMGAVDLVVQVESPPSVASGLQRVGRAGHRVGQTSHGFLYPKHRGDLLTAAVTVKRMLAGDIEPLRIPANPLDILAQQTVAAAALGPIDVTAWFTALRRTAPFATLPQSVFEATLDLLSGRYPSNRFAELKPRLIWDRESGTLEGRPGAQRIAVTSGGTIPDRGLFPVYIVGSDDSPAPKRVGELDEEMVYESRVGDVIALGASSWRIEDISHDRVSVTPAPGQPGKLPFWHGEGPGRPVELGRAVGAFSRRLTAALAGKRGRAERELEEIGLDRWATDNLIAYLGEQQEATGLVPTDRQLVVERFRDELGDWRLVLHSPLGMPVHAPWALALRQRVQEIYGVDASAMAADDGIVLRIPAADTTPSASLFLFETDQLEDIVTSQVGSSALFASRFRENAVRALLLPRYNLARRTPLWQQRQRGAQLLDIARDFPDFPIILETVRECLQDVYDMPALIDLHRAIESGGVRMAEVETESPSPFARTLLFGYVAQYLYEGDSPLAERRAAALSLDPALLSELLGRTELRELLDPDVIRQTEARLQHTLAGYRYRGREGVADLLRLLGPLTAEQLGRRLEQDSSGVAEDGQPIPTLTPDQARAHALGLVAENRALVFQLHGSEHFAAIEDAARLRDGLGVPLPAGVPLAFLQPADQPLVDLVGRYAKTHAPFTASQVAVALGCGRAVAEVALHTLAGENRVISGEFLPRDVRVEFAQSRGGGCGPETEWVDSGVLRTLRTRSLAALRADIEPVPPEDYGSFLSDWQHLEYWQVAEEETGRGAGTGEKDVRLHPRQQHMLAGEDGLLTAVDQLAGVRLPASALEPLILRSRVSDYSPQMLDRVLSSGEVLWAGAGELAGDGWVSLHLSESAALTLPTEGERAERLEGLGPLEHAIYRVLAGGGMFFAQICAALATDEAATGSNTEKVSAALWRLVWAGLVTNDTLVPLRAQITRSHSTHRVRGLAASPRSTLRRGAGRLAGAGYSSASSASGVGQQVSPCESGRWSRVSARDLEPTLAASARAELLLDRYGVLTRGTVAAENTPGGFNAVYRVLAAAEEKGLARRGYFIEGLGAAQFSTATTVDLLRAHTRDEEHAAGSGHERHKVLLCAATDPANPYGAALPWPAVPDLNRGEDSEVAHATGPVRKRSTGHHPGRKAGAVTVLLDGRLALYLERGGRTVLLFAADAASARAAGLALGELVRRGAADKIIIEKVNGVDIVGNSLAGGDSAEDRHPLAGLREGLCAAGFYSTPRGLRIRRAV